jgi:hypothetical protein
MKDPAKEIRSYLVGLTITEGTTAVNVYDHVPKDTDQPYVFISDIVTTESGTKGEFISNVAVTIQVVTKYTTGGGKKRADDIATQITQAACVRSLNYSLTNFKIFGGRLISTNYMDSLSGSERVISKILIIEFLVEQI